MTLDPRTGHMCPIFKVISCTLQFTGTLNIHKSPCEPLIRTSYFSVNSPVGWLLSQETDISCENVSLYRDFTVPIFPVKRSPGSEAVL